MFKVNNKDKMVPLLLTLDSSVSIVDFEHVLAGWVYFRIIFYEYFFPKNLQLEIIFKSLFVLFASICKMLADTNSITS